MNEYTASNGYTIGSSPGLIYIRNRADELRHTLGGYPVEALREFFQHERDEELGRWRWPENPDYVVYARGESSVHVLDEGSGIGATRLIHRNGDPENPTAEYQAAYAYFDAHPGRKPWEDAKPGEVWELVVQFLSEPELARAAALIGRDRFGKAAFWFTDTDSYVEPTNESIKSGRRIWPEDENA